MLKLAVWFVLWNRRCSRVNATCYIFPLIYHISLKVSSLVCQVPSLLSASGFRVTATATAAETPYGVSDIFSFYLFFLFLISSSCFQFSMKPNTPILFTYIFFQKFISRMTCDDRHPTIPL